MTDALADPFATSADMDEDFDPFATTDDVKKSGGVFVPRPPIDALKDRLVVVVPRKFDAEAEVSKYLQEKYNIAPTREEWTLDLIVLDGGPMEYEYRRKVQGTDDEFESATANVTEFPFEVPNFKATHANVIGFLNRLADGPKPFASGRFRLGYAAAINRKKADPYAEFAAEYDAWEEKVKSVGIKKAGDEPKGRWHFVQDDSPEALTLARSWWADAKTRGFKLN
jgi:hypothetical protein